MGEGLERLLEVHESTVPNCQSCEAKSEYRPQHNPSFVAGFESCCCVKAPVQHHRARAVLHENEGKLAASRSTKPIKSQRLKAVTAAKGY